MAKTFNTVLREKMGKEVSGVEKKANQYLR